MPRGKELEQLPMANIAPSMGEDKSRYNRKSLNGMVEDDRPVQKKSREK
ncbi:hypothetical protein [Bacillus seohaeanensis]|jgi:hypothetical protein|uniref:Uncharacterized protein n=1 Tax=Bacillus seohaeanensis TaxID=284580 RepID=A0ABW5RLG7_9BACI